MPTQQNRWLLLLSCICFALFGYFAIVNPVFTIIQLVFYVGILELVTGCFYLYQYFKNKPENSTYLVISSVIGIIFGLAIIFSKTFDLVAITTLPYFVGIWSICFGAIEAFNSGKIAGENKKAWIYVVGGVLGVIYGLFMLFNPYIMLLETQVILGFYFVFFAIVQFVYFIMSFFNKDDK